jgi:hypothetical protein
MKTTIFLKLAAPAAVLLAAAPALAQRDVSGAQSGVRSAQSLPAQAAGKPPRPERPPSAQPNDNPATPPYCSGNKVGIYAGNGQKNGSGQALTCAPDSPG